VTFFETQCIYELFIVIVSMNKL